MEAVLALAIVIGGIIHVGTVVVDGQREDIAQLEQEVQECRADNEGTE